MDNILDSLLQDQPSFLDSLLQIKPKQRIIYGHNKDIKPNNHCVWDDYFSHWVENDQHLRERITKEKQK